jgi:hypothetical protein
LKVIVAGTRTFSDYALLCERLDFYLQHYTDIEIVSGGAKGADTLGERYARERGCLVKQFPADWQTYGKKAGPVRNAQMAAYADACIVFWDGKSKGTQDMITQANTHQLPTRVVHYA